MEPHKEGHFVDVSVHIHRDDLCLAHIKSKKQGYDAAAKNAICMVTVIDVVDHAIKKMMKKCY